MGDFSFVIGQLRTEVEQLKEQLATANAKLEEQEGVTREQGHAIRNMTMVLERVVDQVFPELRKEPTDTVVT